MLEIESFELEKRSEKFPDCDALLKLEASDFRRSVSVESVELPAAAVSSLAISEVIFLNSVGFDLLNLSSSLKSLPIVETLELSQSPL